MRRALNEIKRGYQTTKSPNKEAKNEEGTK